MNPREQTTLNSSILKYFFLLLISANICGTVTQAEEDHCDIPKKYVEVKPTPGSEPVEVGVGIYLIDLLNIDDTDETFTVDGILTLNWKDPRLSEKSLGYSLENCNIHIQSIWYPDMQAINVVDTQGIQNGLVEISSTGVVFYRQRYKGVFYNQFDLKNFPFDTQTLSINLAPLEDNDQIKLIYNKQTTELGKRFKRQDWRLGDLEVQTDKYYIGSMGRDISRINFSFEAVRNTGYYFWNIILPVSLIVLMAWCVFWIDPAQLAAQTGLATAAVFTLVAFRFTISGLLPKVSYLTEMDVFIILSTMLVFFALGESIVTSYLSRKGNETLALRIDKVFRVLYLLLFAVIVLVSFKLLG